MSQRVAIITGISGMDGSHMADLLLEKDYKIIGLVRRAAVPRYDNIEHILDNPNFTLVEGDLLDPVSIRQVISEYQPHVVYNFAAQSHVQTSFKQPSLTLSVNTTGILNILESVRECSKHTRVYQASTSEMFGQNYKIDSEGHKYQDESVEFAPRSPYGVSKLAAHNLVKVYRESYGIYGCSGILFNHEGPRRGHLFVTRKITRWLAKFYHEYARHTRKNHKTIEIKDSEKLRLGNLHAYRDWGDARDFVKAIYLMMEQDTPDDYVIATGKSHSIEQLLESAFNHPNFTGLDFKDYVVIDQAFYRPNEVDYLCGHSWRARQKLGWEPKISFDQMIRDMYENDVMLAHKYDI